MKGNAGVIDALNAILTAELTAINQYFIHYRMLTTGVIRSWPRRSGRNRSRR